MHVPAGDRMPRGLEVIDPRLLNESDFETFKLFAGGLNRSTTAETLRDHFSKYGNVVHSEIVSDKTTGRSRGFGFVTFNNDAGIRAALAVTHRIDNVLVDVKQAIKKERARDLVPSREEANRIFVGGISESVSEDEFKEYFMKYGTVANYNFIVDKNTNRPRGFGFVVYETPADVEKAIGPHTKLGRNCEAKKALPRPVLGAGMNSSMSMGKAGPVPMSPENMDYAAYYYAQANMMYNPYFAQMYASGQMPFMNPMYPYGGWPAQGEEPAVEDGHPGRVSGEEVRNTRDKRYHKSASDHYTSRGGHRKPPRAEPY